MVQALLHKNEMTQELKDTAGSPEKAGLSCTSRKDEFSSVKVFPCSA